MSDEPAGAAESAPTTGGVAWDDAIEEGRKQELWARLQAWWDEKEHGERKGPFASEKLSGAEVFWLAVCALAQKDGTSTDEAEERLRGGGNAVDPFYFVDLPLLCLNGAVLAGAQLQGADLPGAQLQRADLRMAAIQGADLRQASLDGKTRLAEAALCASARWWRRLLAVLAGYGYRPLYTIIWYLVVVSVFALLYHTFGQGCAIPSLGAFAHVALNAQVCEPASKNPLTWNEAYVISLTAFHGRGFFTASFKASDPQAGFAAGEAVVGLLLEISFIATFTQRFFGAK